MYVQHMSYYFPVEWHVGTTEVQPLHLFGPCRRPDVQAVPDVPDVPGLAPKGVPSDSFESGESLGFCPWGMVWIGLEV